MSDNDNQRQFWQGRLGAGQYARVTAGMSQEKSHPLEPSPQAQANEQTRYDSLKEAYKQALEEWETSGDAELWDSASADGLTPEREYNPTK